ncbi:MAG: Rieske (2Fe-2S) protein [Gammaproteobacteria bacterium]|nr:Rieske (2Fe-2S) protein [Gammaproteobacteria bacterium]
MARSNEYNLGPNTFPRGWFVVAESSELDHGPVAVRFFAQDFALYRGESGKPVMLDAYCKHMGTHLAASKSSQIVATNQQIEGDSIRCPYHGWRYGMDGQVNDIPYHDGPCPKSAKIQSYEVRDVMGCVLMWFDPDGGEPEYEPPYLSEWSDPKWIRWELDHLGEIAIHGQEIIDNMVDAQHLGPTHGAPCEFFENEFRNHLLIQRQGGFHATYKCMLTTSTWYTGPGILLSKQNFNESITFQFIANTPIEDGVTKVWHAALVNSSSTEHNEQSIAMAKQVQQGCLEAFAADFDIWRNKKPATKLFQLPNDGSFKVGRTWYKQFFDIKENTTGYQSEVNGFYYIKNLKKPPSEAFIELEQALEWF